MKSSRKLKTLKKIKEVLVRQRHQDRPKRVQQKSLRRQTGMQLPKKRHRRLQTNRPIMRRQSDD